MLLGGWHDVVGVVPGQHRVGSTLAVDASEDHELHLSVEVVCEAPRPTGRRASFELIDRVSPVKRRWDWLKAPASISHRQPAIRLIGATLLGCTGGHIARPLVVSE